MTPLNKVIVIKESMTREEINAIIRGSEHNYFPVVKNNNRITGVLNVKDFLLRPELPLGKLIHPACRIDKGDRISIVLSNFQKTAVNFGVVAGNRDELLGIVTMHDIGESLIGKFA
jgi:CBS domain containing-hemolysin-like protein